jgi:hypothetical protein
VTSISAIGHHREYNYYKRTGTGMQCLKRSTAEYPPVDETVKEVVMGNIHQVEVVVHVDDALNEGQKAEMVKHLRECEGVEDARFTPGRDHLLLVDYDRDRLRSKDVLGYVRETRTGAELVGPM